MVRRAARIDGNHAALRAAWECAGGSWQNISAVQGGEPDAVIGRGGMMWLIEVKALKGKLREKQVAWHAAWRGAPVLTVRTWADLARLVEMSRDDEQPL